MVDSEKLDLILSEIQGMKVDMKDMKVDVQDMKAGMHGMKADIRKLQDDMQGVKRRIKDVELHLENVTNKNIQLLAENFIELTKKLNQAIPVADKNLAYEVKVNYLVDDVAKLKKDLTELKSRAT